MKRPERRKGSGDRRFLCLADNLALDLVNTEVIEDGRRADWLQEPRDLAAWLQQTGIAKSAKVGARLLNQDKTLRAEIRRMAEALAAGRPVAASVISAINRELRRVRKFQELSRSGRGYEIRTRSEPGGSMLTPIAQSAAELLAHGDRLRVRRCGNPACILHFYDTTRSRTRRWCSMAGCGNRMKVAAHYRRRRGR